MPSPSQSHQQQSSPIENTTNICERCKQIKYYLFYLSIGLQPKQCKKCEFYLGRGRFHNLLVMGQPNGPLQQQKNHQNICALGYIITN
jgi:hypothetical protein